MSSVLLGLVAALSWGVNDFLARFPSRAVGPLPTVLVATFAGLVILTVWLLLGGHSIRISWPQLWLPATSGIFFTLSTLSLFAALALGPVSLVTPIAGSYPALAMFFAVAQGARPSLLQWLAVAGVLTGVVLVSRSGETYEQSGYIPPGKLKIIVALALCASSGSAVAQTSGQAAAVELGEIAAVWLARIFGLITIGAIYLMQRSRGAAGPLAPSPRADGWTRCRRACRHPRRRQPARPGLRHGRLLGLQRGHRGAGASDPQGADIADTAPRDDPYLWWRCRIGRSLVRESSGNAELLCDEAAEPLLTAPRGDR